MSIVQSRWKLIATIALAVTVIGWALAAMQPKRFRASSIVAVVPAEGIDADQVYRGVEVLQYRTVVATIAALASTTVTQRDAIGSEAAGTYSIRATVMPHADLLRFEVEGPDAQKTAAAANRLPVLLSARTAAMYRFYRLSLVAPATTPEEPFYPRAGRAAAAGLIAGLALAFAVAYAFERFQPARR